MAARADVKSCLGTGLWQTLPPKYEWIGGIFLSYLGENIKKLGFGLMRLPQQNDIIDIEQTKQMVDLFIKAGFTYF